MSTPARQVPEQSGVWRNSAAGLRQALPMLARFIGRSVGATIRFGGRPATDGKTIFLPHLPLQAGQRLVAKIRAWLFHEAGHIRFTSFSPKGVKIKDMPKIERGLLNTVEDPRMERQVIMTWPAAAEAFDLCRSFMYEDKEARVGDRNEMDSIQTFILHKGWEIYDYCPSVRHRLDDTRGYLKGFLGDQLAGELEALLDERYPQLSSTDDAYDLALEIIELLEFHAYSKGNEGARRALEQTPYDTHEDSEESLEKEAQKEVGEAKGKGEPTTEDGSLEETVPGEDPNALGRMRDMASTATTRLARELQRLLADAQRPTEILARRGSRFKRNRLARLRVGDSKVLKKTQDSPVELPAISLCIDLSGSMRGEEQDLAVAGAIALGDALARARISFEVFGFEDDTLHRAKGFETPWQQAQSRVGALATVSGGGTPWGAALYEVGSGLAARTEKRKLLITLADGGPNDPDSVYDAIARLRAHQVDVMGIGIKTDAVSQFIHDAVRVDDVAALGPALIKAVKAQIPTRK